MRYIYFDPNILRKYAPKAGKFPPLKEVPTYNLKEYFYNLFKYIYYNRDAFISFTFITSKGKKTVLNAISKIIRSGDLDNSNRDSNKSIAFKGLKNSGPLNPYNYYSYFTDRKCSIKEESIGKFYNDNKKDKVTFNIWKTFIEFNNLEINTITSKVVIKIPVFERPTPKEIREFIRKGRCFNCYKKGYISSEYSYKEKFVKCFDAYLNSITNII
ncbi:uncharacterized protein B0T23DRAFT_403288 [Neurospora hispaniola]|uniref:Uncharacterized protein n=1 Tax=Neurospora hispaniola TaxID=588809 RepID=A0AAJ0I9B9_9PEZI|nr:hypothetical protein B0T23DRAFT_403288 [Neurospora hispaniola]